MKNVDLGEDLTLQELSALKQIRLTGLTGDRAATRKFLDEALVVNGCDGRLQLTAKGRQMLVRGSPLLWDLAS